MSATGDVRTAVPGAAALPLLRRRMPELDSMRGVAAGAVFLYHLLLFSGFRVTEGPLRIPQALARGGWMGVNFFFVLSGFLITGILLDGRSRANYYATFYVKRVFRILPLYYLLLVLIVGLLAWAGRPPATATVVAIALFSANTDSIFGFELSGPLGIYWSLAVEEHFYLAWPFVVAKLGPKGLKPFVLAGLVASPLVRLALHAAGVDVYLFTLCRLDALFLGAWIAVLVREEASVARAKRIAAAMAGGGLLLGAALVLRYGVSRTHPVMLALQFTAIDLVCGSVVLGGLIAFRGAEERAGLAMRALASLGDISYFTYLAHPALALLLDRLLFPGGVHDAGTLYLRLAVNFVGLVALGFASRTWFELPVFKLRDRVLASLAGRGGATSRAAALGD